LALATKKRAPVKAPFSIPFSIRLEVSVETEEVVPAEAIERITTCSTEQAEGRLTVEQVVNADIEAELISHVKSETDIVIQN
jgi:hypothetical protein